MSLGTPSFVAFENLGNLSRGRGPSGAVSTGRRPVSKDFGRFLGLNDESMMIV
jgi:hypothetical protein